MQRVEVESIPVLKADDGILVHDPTNRVELLAWTFSGTFVFTDVVVNEYTELERNQRPQKLLMTWSESDFCKALTSLDASSGTGPDLLPSLMLKNCANELSLKI